ncbi:ATP-dependent helicase hrq1 [Frankliniella fusca]|uniref:ATP-dependent helicase hrq1 n=1 Tax=Frankliniella fusca TaxID=407009 RepID=A0AAE1LHA1_9NEOP|nr:ATP-dependent helicase hrq1 [Frankliniella fusca]
MAAADHNKPSTVFREAAASRRQLGPTKENPHPIPFQSPANSTKPFPSKRFHPNVRDTELYGDIPVVHAVQPEQGNSFDADDPNEPQESVLSSSSVNFQSPGLVSKAAIPNATPNLDTFVDSLAKFNVLPVIVEDIDMETKSTEGPEDDMSQVPDKNKPYNPFAVIGKRLHMAMKKGSFCSDCSEKIVGKGGSFESVLGQPLRSFEVLDKDEDQNFIVNKPWGKEKDSEEEGPKEFRDQSVQTALPLLTFEMIITSQKWSDFDFRYFTGLSKESFEVLYKFLGGNEVCSKLKYYRDQTPNRECGTTHTPKGCLLMTLVRLRRGYSETEMEKFFGLSDTSISCIFTAWIKFMSFKFKSLEPSMFVSVEMQERNKPQCFKPFPNLRCIVDATEIKIQKPKNLEQQSNTYSSYKGCNTVKFLVASSVYGGLSYISEGFEGNISDRKLFLKSGILDHINPDEAIMVDRGFDIEADLNKRDIDIIIPPFLGGRTAFTEREMYIGKAIETSRIHVETLIGRIKAFKLVRYVVPNTMLDVLSHIVRVCSVLTNFQDPFVRWEDEASDMF